MIPECLCVVALIAPPIVTAPNSDPLLDAARYPRVMNAFVDAERARASDEAAARRAAEARAASRAAERTSPTSLDSGLNWAALRDCESGGDYAINTGNGFSGAYQFTDSTWQAMGGSGSAYTASPAEQDMRAQRLYDVAGASPWPVCGQLL